MRKRVWILFLVMGCLFLAGCREPAKGALSHSNPPSPSSTLPLSSNAPPSSTDSTRPSDIVAPNQNTDATPKPSDTPPSPPVSTTPNADLVPFKHRHFTISVPQGWKAELSSTSGDQVILHPLDEEGVYVAIYTFALRNATREHLLGRWQFNGRNPQPFKTPGGQDGFIAEGPLSTDATKQILALGYWRDGLYEQIVHAVAPKETFESKRALFERILKTHQPHPATDK